MGVGRSCTGCGKCCKLGPCWIGFKLHGWPEGGCPELVERDGRYWCRLVLNASSDDRERIDKLLSIGKKCGAPLVWPLT